MRITGRIKELIITAGGENMCVPACECRAVYRCYLHSPPSPQIRLTHPRPTSHHYPTQPNSPPVLIENELKAALPSLASCMVIGDKRKFLTVLLTLHTDDDGNLIGA